MKPKRIGTFRFRVEVYLEKGKDLDFRWRLVAQSNGKIVADSAEGYHNRGHAVRMVRDVFNSAWPIVFVYFDGSRKVLRPRA
jgi:uncharacterized protein YegP (UPF0339 family)